MSDLYHHTTDTLPLSPGNAVAAIIFLEDGRYLLQLRDSKKGIFFPSHWGLFGGGIDAGEEPVDAIQREIREELGIEVRDFTVNSRFDFDLSPMGLGCFHRIFFTLKLPVSATEQLNLGEGEALKFFDKKEILSNSIIITPYDSFALWIHLNRSRLICNL
ncbi:MAG: NUDIX domain-containing protein [Alphaproteobacteria bacterium]|nr:NUDIX domain-containing protein [Alphaproteobacteria bacterium]